MNIKKITQGKNLTDTEQTVLEYSWACSCGLWDMALLLSTM